MMRFRNTVILVALCGALAAFAYFTEMRGRTDVSALEESTPTPLWEIQAAEIVRLDVNGPEGSAHLSRAAGAPWQLVDPSTQAQQPADDARVTRVIGYLAQLRPTRTLTETGALVEYGLETPAWQATLGLQNGEERTIRWGDQTPSGTAYYVIQRKEGPVHLIASFTIEELQRLVREPAYPPTPTPPAATSATIVAPTPSTAGESASPPTPTPAGASASATPAATATSTP